MSLGYPPGSTFVLTTFDVYTGPTVTNGEPMDRGISPQGLLSLPSNDENGKAIEEGHDFTGQRFSALVLNNTDRTRDWKRYIQETNRNSEVSMIKNVRRRFDPVVV